MLLESQGRKKFQLQQETFWLYTGKYPKNYEDQHGDYDYAFSKKEGESIHESCAAMNMAVGNIPSQKRVSH